MQMTKSLILAFALLLLSSVTDVPYAADVGGTLAADTVWSPALGTVTVLANVIVPAGVKLTIAAGTQVHVTNSAAIQIEAGGTLDIAGTEENPVWVAYLGTGRWLTVTAGGNNSVVTVRHAEFSHGGIMVGSQSTLLVEDSYLHDLVTGIEADNAKSATLRRIHVSNYDETIFNGTLTLAEDSLFENMSAANDDALELQGAPPGCEVRRCTFRHSTGNNSDAFDCNGSQQVFVHDCLFYDISDKGISFGTATAYNQAACLGMVVSNCLIYYCGTGLAVKDKSTASIYNCTFVDSPYGIRLYEKYSPPGGGSGIGGEITNGFDNIVWGNTNVDALVASNSALSVAYSDVGDTNAPGAGNLNVDPRFANATVHDYRLSDASPLLHAGIHGGPMGAHFPLGAPMAPSHPSISSVQANGSDCVLRFWVDEGKPYRVESSDTVSNQLWETVATIPAQPLPRQLNVTNVIAAAHQFYRLATP
jgi:hypothetical protein